MISHGECLKILAKYGTRYKDQEIDAILGFLKNLADIALNDYYMKNGKGDSLHQGFNG